MNKGDLVMKYSHNYDDDNDCALIIEDVGIILSGSWYEGSFRVLFSRSGVNSARTGTIRRIRLRS